MTYQAEKVFLVKYEISIMATNSREAAEMAFEWLNSSDSQLPVFEVINEMTGEQHTIDLSAPGDD